MLRTIVVETENNKIKLVNVIGQQKSIKFMRPKDEAKRYNDGSVIVADVTDARVYEYVKSNGEIEKMEFAESKIISVTEVRQEKIILA